MRLYNSRQTWRSEENSRRLDLQFRPLSVTSVNPNSCEALKNRAKLTCKGTHVTTYRPINIGVRRRPQGREAKGGNKPRERPLLQARGLRWLLCVIGET